MDKLCECGCGEVVKRRFARGHNRRGKNHKLTEETKQKIAAANRGKRLSPETRRKVSESKRGKRHPNYGKNLPLKVRRKISQALTGRRLSKETRAKVSKANRGERNPSWLGGISFEPYGLDFNKARKQKIRERDGFVCQLCGIPENGKAHHCHHIDYDKRNNESSNLISLCSLCHPRTNTNRAFWATLFQARAEMRLRRK